MWYLIFSFLTILNIMAFIYPFLINIDVRFNILRLKGTIYITIFNKIKFEFNIRIKNGYVYINHKNKLRKEKISNKNISIIFIFKLLNQMYFREQFLDFIVRSNFGYINDSCVTAVVCGYIDVLGKSLLSKLKNNKKSSHIFIDVEPKYNEDIFNIRLYNTIRMSVFDILYAVIYSLIYVWRYYEKNGKNKSKQGQKN